MKVNAMYLELLLDSVTILPRKLIWKLNILEKNSVSIVDASKVICQLSRELQTIPKPIIKRF